MVVTLRPRSVVRVVLVVIDPQLAKRLCSVHVKRKYVVSKRREYSRSIQQALKKIRRIETVQRFQRRVVDVFLNEVRKTVKSGFYRRAHSVLRKLVLQRHLVDDVNERAVQPLSYRQVGHGAQHLVQLVYDLLDSMQLGKILGELRRHLSGLVVDKQPLHHIVERLQSGLTSAAVRC